MRLLPWVAAPSGGIKAKRPPAVVSPALTPPPVAVGEQRYGEAGPCRMQSGAPSGPRTAGSTHTSIRTAEEHRSVGKAAALLSAPPDPAMERAGRKASGGAEAAARDAHDEAR